MDDVYFNNWNDKSAPKSYWQDIENIAKDIGELLKINSTIFVFSTKEKFGECRVYIGLADFETVKKSLKLSDNPSNPEENYDLICAEQDKRLLEDARHYRKIYLLFKEKYPQYWNKSIKGGADYPELLAESKSQTNRQIFGHSGTTQWLEVLKKVYENK